MGRIFNFEGPVFGFLSKFADLIWLNILFIICCIPIFTIGAATTAMYYVTLKMAKDEEGYITKAFFKSFKDNFKQATGIWLIFAVVFIVILADLKIINGGSLSNIIGSGAISGGILVTIGIVAIVLLITYIYVFPLLARFDNTIKNTIRNAFLIGVRHLPYTFVMILVAISPIVIMYFSTAAYLLVFIMFSLVAYINSIFYNKIFVRYMPKEETEENDGEAVENTVG